LLTQSSYSSSQAAPRFFSPRLLTYPQFRRHLRIPGTICDFFISQNSYWETSFRRTGFLPLLYRLLDAVNKAMLESFGTGTRIRLWFRHHCRTVVHQIQLVNQDVRKPASPQLSSVQMEPGLPLAAFSCGFQPSLRGRTGMTVAVSTHPNHLTDPPSSRHSTFLIGL